METHIEGTMYGVSYGWYKVWKLIYKVKCMENLIQLTMYGDSYRGYNVWRII